MRCAVVLLVLSAACAPKEDYTPRVDVEPLAAGRLCYASFQAEKREAGPWSHEVERACDDMRSDLRGPPRPIYVDDAPDATDVDVRVR